MAPKRPADKGAPKTRRAPAKRRPAKPKQVDLHARGARVVSVFGPFAASALVLMPTKLASELFTEDLAESGATATIEGLERDLAAIAKRDEALALSTLAGVARRLAIELEHPYNSATSKASVAGELRETMDRLWAFAPAEKETDVVDDLRARRQERVARRAAAVHLPRS
jgi:hypothetical protein